MDRLLLLDFEQALTPLLKAQALHEDVDLVVAESSDQVSLLIQGAPTVALVLVTELDQWQPVLPLLATAPRPIPLVAVVRRTDPLDLSAALRAGARDVVVCPCSARDFFGRLGAVLARPTADEQAEAPFTLLLGSNVRAGARALVAVAAALQACPPARERRRLEATKAGVRQTFDKMIAAVLGSMEGSARAGHARRVGHYCALIGGALGLSAARIAALQTAGLLADVGLDTTNAPWLATDQPLSDEQWRVVRGHPAQAAALSQPLLAVGVPVAAILAHHERLDGSGYPEGLLGPRIGLEARALAVADVFAGLTAPRPYRAARTAHEAIGELEREVASGRLCSRAVGALRGALEVGGNGMAVASGSTVELMENPDLQTSSGF